QRYVLLAHRFSLRARPSPRVSLPASTRCTPAVRVTVSLRLYVCACAPPSALLNCLTPLRPRCLCLTISFYPLRFAPLSANASYPLLTLRFCDCAELVAFLKESNPNAISGPAKTEEIRILHLGKFLDDAKTLQECKFASGPDNLTTVHISLRVPTKASEDVKEKINKKGSACCEIM
ncbi:unnamed protein product, partial [Chondrus crispus]